MMSKLFVISLFCVLYCSGENLIDIIFERAYITCNPMYLANCSISVTKKDRASPYVLNMYNVRLHAWNENVSVHIVGYERLGNVYKESVINLVKNMCNYGDDSDTWFSNLLTNYSNFETGCPKDAGESIIKDMVMDSKYLSQFLAVGRYRMLMNFYQTDTKETVGDLDVYIKIEAAKLNLKKLLPLPN